MIHNATSWMNDSYGLHQSKISEIVNIKTSNLRLSTEYFLGIIISSKKDTCICFV